MGMKPPMNEPFGSVVNEVTCPKKTGHYDSVQNAVTNISATQNPNPTNSDSGTTTKGPVPGA